MEQSVLLVLDMQHDFIHSNGAFGRAGLYLSNNRPVIESMIKVTDYFRSQKTLIVSAQFTLIANKDNQPLIDDHLKKSWPFLTRGDFQHGRWGHQLIDELGPADYTINRLFDSAFHMTYMEWLLRKFDVRKIYFAGLNIGSSLVSTVRDAAALGFEPILLSNGCNAFDDAGGKDALLGELRGLGVQMINGQELWGRGQTG